MEQEPRGHKPQTRRFRKNCNLFIQMTFGRLCVGVCANVRTFLQRIALRWKIKQKRNVRGLIKVRSTKSVKNCFCFFFYEGFLLILLAQICIYQFVRAGGGWCTPR